MVAISRSSIASNVLALTIVTLTVVEGSIDEYSSYLARQEEPRPVREEHEGGIPLPGQPFPIRPENIEDDLVLKQPDVLDDDLDCAICFGDVEGATAARTTFECSHGPQFHEWCLERWRERQEEKGLRHTCPNCRAEVRGTSASSSSHLRSVTRGVDMGQEHLTLLEDLYEMLHEAFPWFRTLFPDAPATRTQTEQPPRSLAAIASGEGRKHE